MKSNNDKKAKRVDRPQEPTIERRNLADLKPHPLQHQFFEDLPDHEAKALADDIKRNGLRQPIEVLEDGTILKGHQRVRALRLNGKTATDALVRYDLVIADDATIEREFLEDNQNRRQLTPLAKARNAIRLYEIANGKPRGSMLKGRREEVREIVSKALRMSGRNLNRYLLVLNAPLEIQDALESNQLPLILAGKVALLDRQVQKRSAERIRSGESPKTVVAEYLANPKDRHVKPRDALNAFVKVLIRGVNDLADRVDQIPAHAVATKAKELRRARKLLRTLLDRVNGAVANR
jgi:hypothetical protein